MGIAIREFGKTKCCGKTVNAYTLTNDKGMEATVINYGAILQSLKVPDRDGKIADVVLGYDTLEPYFDNPCYFGATVGRNANRIKDAVFTLDGKEYKLPVNDGPNNLHSDYDHGMHKRFWEAQVEEGSNSIVFYLREEDGQNGFPGNLEMTVTYRLTQENELLIAYHGVSDKKTVINCTNHSYFNLAGHDSGDIYDQKIRIKASRYTTVVEGAIPTGEWAKVTGTPFDLRELTSIGEHIDDDFEQLKLTGGYDHNFCVDNADHTVREIAVAVDEKSGRQMTVLTDLPGVQFYAGNYIDNISGKSGAVYNKRNAFCLETQYFPDSVNQEGFERPVFDAGKEYSSSTIYKFSVI